MSHLNAEQFKNNTVSPNQLAFQGMERGAHPTAALARQGYSFKIERETEDEHGSPVDTYHLIAKHDAIAGEAASLSWAGKDHGYHADYPGEIEMANTMPAHQRKGLATALYKHATDTNLGQQTRPVHSAILTAYGAAWSRSVGGPGADERGNSEAPEGYHPFEAHQEPDIVQRRAQRDFHDRRLQKSGQRLLPGMDMDFGSAPTRYEGLKQVRG